MAAFLAGVLGPEPLRAWQAFLVNFLYWTGLSFGAVLFVAVLNLTGARWGRSLKRPAEAFGAFLPCGFVLFWVLYAGRAYLFPWITAPVPGKEAWLDVPFFFARNGAGILILSCISLAMVRYSVKADHALRGAGQASTDRHDLHWRRQQVLSPALAIAYAFVLSLMGFDLVMSLDRQWYSTLLGGYFFVGAFYTGVAALFLLAIVLGRTDEFGPYLLPRHLHDLGKLLLAFCLFTGYLFYAQFLTIWYGNVPEETRYVILRVKLTQWEPLAWIVLFMVFVVPFFMLLSRKVKTKRLPMAALAIVVLVGMWLERLILVAPSLWKGRGIPLGGTEVLIVLGFLGLMTLCVIAFLRRVPVLPVSDPLFGQWLQEKEERLEP